MKTKVQTWVFRAACVFTLLLPPVGVAVAAQEAEPDKTRSSDELPWPPKASEPIDDRALMRYLEVAGRELIDTGCTLTNWKSLVAPKTGNLTLPASSRRKLSGPQLAQRLESAVGVIGVFYLCPKCTKLHPSTASGFFINRTGAFATCRHVLANYADNGRGLIVLTRNGRACAVRDVIASDPLQDLVILQVDGGPFEALPLARELQPAGSPVAITSHPEQHFFAYSTGVISRYGLQQRGKKQLRWMTVTADFAKGSSGAPVCNESGAVVGIVNNTESIYYTVEKERQENLQMVVRNCTPVSCLVDLVQPISRQASTNK